MSGAWLVLFLGLWAVCILLVLLVLGLSRRIQSLESIVLGSGATSVHDEATARVREQLLGADVAKQAVDSGLVEAAGGVAGVVLFVSEHCGPCQALASDLSATLQRNGANGLTQLLDTRITVITDQIGPFGELGATAVIADPDGATMNGFAITSTPTGIALDQDGVVIDAMIANQFLDVKELAQVIQPVQLEVVKPTVRHAGKIRP